MVTMQWEVDGSKVMMKAVQTFGRDVDKGTMAAIGALIMQEATEGAGA